MNVFKNLSIKAKLVVIILVVTTTVLSLGFTYIFIYDVKSLKNNLVNLSIMNARLVGGHCVTPLIFGDQYGAREVLSTIQNFPQLLYACVYDTNGNIFAEFGTIDRKAMIESEFVREESLFKSGFLHIFQPIIYKGERYGSIYMRVSAEKVKNTIRKDLVTIFFLLGALVLFAYMMALRLQQTISRPILELAEVTKRISGKADYSVQIKRLGRDEIGILYEEFNNMIKQIQIREAERDRAEAALRDSERKFRTISSAAQDAIIMIDSKGRVTYWNRAAERIFGYSAKEVRRRDIYKLIIPPRHRTNLKNRLNMLFGEKADYPEGKVLELECIKKNGELLPVELSLSCIVLKGKLNTISIIRDISERKKAEERIRRDLREKEVMLKEIHHRVKNNLQVICSLLSLQARYIKDRQSLSMFEESRTRVRSMALVHEKLYRSANLSEIDFNSYVESLVRELYRTYHVDPMRIDFNIEVEDVKLGVNLAVPCGLIINELVSNALKHAFPARARRSGKISIRFGRIEGGELELVVCDNGVGFPEGFDSKRSDSLGLHLVKILVEDQLDGRIEIDSKSGCEFRIIFREKGEDE